MLSGPDALLQLLPLAFTMACGGGIGWWLGRARGYDDALEDVRAELQRRAGGRDG